MLASFYRSLPTVKWNRPSDLDLSALIRQGDQFSTKVVVTEPMTTNRTKKPGDDILSTPSMIDTMDNYALEHANSRLSNNYTSIIRKVSCNHKAPLSIGKTFSVDGRVKNVSKDAIEYSVICSKVDSNTVIGDATIIVEVIKPI